MQLQHFTQLWHPIPLYHFCIGLTFYTALAFYIALACISLSVRLSHGGNSPMRENSPRRETFPAGQTPPGGKLSPRFFFSIMKFSKTPKPENPLTLQHRLLFLFTFFVFVWLRTQIFENFRCPDYGGIARGAPLAPNLQSRKNPFRSRRSEPNGGT